MRGATPPRAAWRSKSRLRSSEPTIGQHSLYNLAYADYCFASRRHEPAGPGHGGPDALPDPDDPAGRPELPGRALARAGADPVERVEPPDLSSRLRDRGRRARGSADALRDRRPAPRGGAHGAGGRDAGRGRARAVHGRRVHGAGLLRDGSGRVSAAWGCDEPGTRVGEETEEERMRTWWRDRGIMVPALSGDVFGTGLALEWTGADVPALGTCWTGSLLCTSTRTQGEIS